MKWLDHLTAVAALGTASLVAARLLAVSRYDPTTAATILQTAGTTTVVVGTALSLLPFAVAFGTCVLGLSIYVDRRLLGTHREVHGEYMVLPIAVSIMVVPVALCELTLFFVGACAIVGWRARRRHKPIDLRGLAARSALIRYELAVLAAVLVLTPIMLPQPWLPNEFVRLKDGRVLVGYALGDLNGRLAFMRDKDRSVLLLNPTTITDRQICAGPASLAGHLSSVPRLTLHGSVLGSVLFGSDVPSYASCPTERLHGK